MKNKTKLLAVAGLAMALPATANITSPPVTFLYADPDLSNASGYAAAVAASLVEHGYTVPTTLSLLYKATPSGSEEGNGNLFNMSVANTPPPTGEQTATLDYTGTGTLPSLWYIAVKDGQAGSAIFRISGWDGVSDIQVDNSGLWNPQGRALSGISGVYIFGTPGSQDERLPDGGATLALLGLSVVGLGAVRKFKCTPVKA